ncbi:hypothetical protein COV81_02440 [Candidatus Peregrinibacteria bacterium CG11_big_fil_rev_8_21_14_0_20_41_10]|nr:MAG: hypothetical protein COV81_02440 [Candidatus Peregrinibacteria bacterium CG11_big_fil_rev_8_21_14_0_20_41_10]PIZ77164.1 MAG: hypothetical protein COY06_00900 [Candidatus Peregrinibacteria bacterium CG_4_10_14_0_2_um_filter_41_8]PJC38161.1 MAG: hypothetical protein CO045_01720 [Candidatus Peregrinibacteria bacterium CG_4_9_14_0_2_um_filter_41_14]
MKELELLSIGLKFGQLVLYPTDTCLGLGHDILSKEGARRLYDFKGMPATKPYSVLVNDIEMAKIYGEFNSLALELWERYLPGKLTILVPRTKALPANVNENYDYVGFRWMDVPEVNQLISNLGNPISTTSANKYGEKVIRSLDDFVGQFGDALADVNFMVDFRKEYDNRPSTIVKVLGEKKMELIREGELFEKIKQELGAYIY